MSTTLFFKKLRSLRYNYEKCGTERQTIHIEHNKAQGMMGNDTEIRKLTLFNTYYFRLSETLLLSCLKHEGYLRKKTPDYNYIILWRHVNCNLYWYDVISRSHWPCVLRRRSTAVRLLGLWVRITPRAWISVCCECCVLSGRGLCHGLITRLEESYRVWCV
jgi:hypothetical protein